MNSAPGQSNRVDGFTLGERVIVAIFLFLNVDVLFYLAVLFVRGDGKFSIGALILLTLYALFVLTLVVLTYRMFRLPAS